MKSIFISRISIPLWLGIWGFVFIIMALSFGLDLSIENIASNLFGLVVWAVIFLFLAVVCLGTMYKIKDDQLVIKIGPLTTHKIRISNIHSIERSYELQASPANAVRRLKISFNDYCYILISPTSEKVFLKHLKSINPDIDLNLLEKT